MGNWLKRLEQWLGGGAGGARKMQTFRWLIILGLIGVAIMLFNSFVNVKKLDHENIGREPPPDTAAVSTTQGLRAAAAAVNSKASSRISKCAPRPCWNRSLASGPWMSW